MSIKTALVCANLFLIFFTIIYEINGKPPAKITGGSEAAISEFPAIVSVRYRWRHICGGVLITPKHVLTAAHCLVDELPLTKKIIPYSPWEITVASGSNNCLRPKNVNLVEKIHVHPQYVGAQNAHFNDIGVIELRADVVADPESQFPISLPSVDCKVGENATVAGWGTTYPREMKVAEVLQKVPAITLSNWDCRLRTHNVVGNGQLCAFYSKGFGFCDGDSGGPLIANNTVIGIVSLSYDCGAGYPDVYTRVYSYVPWIEEKINVLVNGKPPKKIVGGSVASIYDYPALVSIQLHGSHLCGGVFITMRHILTAAHCLAYQDQTNTLRLFNLNDISIASGSSNAALKLFVHQPKQLIIHPNYKGSVDWHGDDIGIIELTETVKRDATHQVVRLPNTYCGSDLYATVLGWGYLYAFSGRTSDWLQQAPVITLSNEKCLQSIPYQINENHLCGVYSQGIGFCDGDSGGPLLMNGEVVGVVSMGYECGSGSPDIYTRVHPYVPWIQSVIKGY
ncbi:serine protease 30-like [Chelonus insularis]|uniref:serine protease 30-like n=1 Tax=Chelonus insularis TaxID=460826 RepID=UPI001589BD99|nr:serine protease 30-like [Chelonus insularis]